MFKHGRMRPEDVKHHGVCRLVGTAASGLCVDVRRREAEASLSPVASRVDAADVRLPVDQPCAAAVASRDGGMGTCMIAMTGD